MANAAYPNGLTGLMTGLIDLDTAAIKCAFVRSYTYSTAHTFMSDVTGAGGVLNGVSAALTTPTVTAGVFDADDTTATTANSASNHALIIYQASAVTGGADVAASAQRLLFYYDTGTGLPVVPGTGTQAITFDNGTNKIVKFG